MAQGYVNEFVLLVVKFPSDKAGLTTVGCTLKNADGTVNVARSTVGVIARGNGAYSINITRTAEWKGTVLWDTGEAIPLHAPEEDIWIINKLSSQASVDALQVDLGDPSAEATTILAKVKDLDKGSGTVARTLNSMGTDYLAKLNGALLAGVVVKAYLKTDLARIKGQITTNAAGDGTLYMVPGQTYVLYYEYHGNVMTKEYIVP